MTQPKKEVCTIRIIFPVQSDEQAIDCKKKIGVILSEIPDVIIDFRLSNLPSLPLSNSPIPK